MTVETERTVKAVMSESSLTLYPERVLERVQFSAEQTPRVTCAPRLSLTVATSRPNPQPARQSYAECHTSAGAFALPGVKSSSTLGLKLDCEREALPPEEAGWRAAAVLDRAYEEEQPAGGG